LSATGSSNAVGDFCNVKAIGSAYIRHESDISLSTSGFVAEAEIHDYGGNRPHSTVVGRLKWHFVGDRKFKRCRRLLQCQDNRLSLPPAPDRHIAIYFRFCGRGGNSLVATLHYRYIHATLTLAALTAALIAQRCCSFNGSSVTSPKSTFSPRPEVKRCRRLFT